MISDEVEKYSLRGHMVTYKSDLNVKLAAQAATMLLDIKHETIDSLDQFVEMLRKEYKIEIVFEYDRKWIWISDAACDPGILTMAMPQRLFLRALKGDREALFVFFHELGHILLGHKAVLHHNKSDYCKEVDSEHQADMFAETVLQIIGLRQTKEHEGQYHLRFE